MEIKVLHRRGISIRAIARELKMTRKGGSEVCARGDYPIRLFSGMWRNASGSIAKQNESMHCWKIKW